MQTSPQQNQSETENHTTTEQSQTEDAGNEEFYDDGLVHSHSWAASSYTR